MCTVQHANNRLAKTVEGNFVESLSEYLENLDYLATMSISFNDQTIFNFDDKFYRVAASEELPLSDNQQKPAVAAKHFHAENRGTVSSKLSNQLFRGSFGQQKGAPGERYKFLCCHRWQEDLCLNSAGDCN